MQRSLILMLMGWALITACTGSEAPSSSMPSSADWSKIGDTDVFTYYADHGSLKKADETVTLSDLFDYQTAQTEGGVDALSKITLREYDCQNQESQAMKTTWYAGHMGSGAVVRTSGPSGQLTPVASGTATAGLMKIACSR
jgi:hypothetical protein